MTSRHAPILLAVLFSALIACTDDDGVSVDNGMGPAGDGDSGCFPGAAGCGCFNGSCQTGLSCVQNLCVSSTGNGGNGGTGGNGGGDGDGTGGGGGDGDGSGGGGGDGDGSGGGGGGDGDGDSMAGMGETGRMVGMTAGHNEVRAEVGVGPMTWSPEIAAVAQAYADELAQTCSFNLVHSGNRAYGENIAASGSFGGGGSTAQTAVDGWAAEVQCWTYGTISGLGVGGTEQCDMQCTMAMNSNGCGHYTQVVWSGSTELGCGVGTCDSGGTTMEFWVCNYAPPGNVVGQAPY